MDTNYFTIIEHIGTLTYPVKSWNKELNIISWKDNSPKFDLRLWSSEHDKCGKGITLSYDELLLLKKVIDDYLQK